MSNIFFYSADKPVSIKNTKTVKRLIIALFNEENKTLERINYVFCSDTYLLKINKQYLRHDTFTDVITFQLSKTNEPVYGEVYLSVERIKENAKAYNEQYQTELLRVIIHGALHLCGYNDKTKQLQAKMHSKEDYYIKQYKVSREANS